MGGPTSSKQLSTVVLHTLLLCRYPWSSWSTTSHHMYTHQQHIIFHIRYIHVHFYKCMRLHKFESTNLSPKQASLGNIIDTLTAIVLQWWQTLYTAIHYGGLSSLHVHMWCHWDMHYTRWNFTSFDWYKDLRGTSANPMYNYKGFKVILRGKAPLAPPKYTQTLEVLTVPGCF